MATSTNQTDFVKTALRLPPKLHEQIHAAAAESGRTYNAELVNRLDASLNETGSGLTVRLDPKLRYLAELGARKLRRTLASYIEWAVGQSLKEVVLEVSHDHHQPDTTLENVSLWDVDPAERFARLAIAYPELLTHEEQQRWKMLGDCGLLSPAKSRDNRTGAIQWDWAELEDHVFPQLRSHWSSLLNAQSSGSTASASWIEKMSAELKPVRAPAPAPRPRVTRPSSGFDDMDDDIKF